MRKMASFLQLRLFPKLWSLECQKWFILRMVYFILGLHVTIVDDIPFQMCFMLEKQHQPNKLCVNVRILSL